MANEQVFASCRVRDEAYRRRCGSKYLSHGLVRAWSILRDLTDAPAGLTLQQLADKYRVGVETIRRDFSSLQTAGFRISGARGTGRQHRWRLQGALMAAAPDPNVTAAVTFALRVFRTLERAVHDGRTLEQLAAAAGASQTITQASLRVLQAAGLPVVYDSTDGEGGKRWRIREWRREVDRVA